VKEQAQAAVRPGRISIWLAGLLAATGAVTRAYSSKVKKGRVKSQRPRPGKRLKSGARVDLVVSRGRR
jgi:beta-lactam-binding protein with PASTA domain